MSNLVYRNMNYIIQKNHVYIIYKSAHFKFILVPSCLWLHFLNLPPLFYHPEKHSRFEVCPSRHSLMCLNAYATDACIQLFNVHVYICVWERMYSWVRVNCTLSNHFLMCKCVYITFPSFCKFLHVLLFRSK